MVRRVQGKAVGVDRTETSELGTEGDGSIQKAGLAQGSRNQTAKARILKVAPRHPAASASERKRHWKLNNATQKSLTGDDLHQNHRL